MENWVLVELLLFIDTVFWNFLSFIFSIVYWFIQAISVIIISFCVGSIWQKGTSISFWVFLLWIVGDFRGILFSFTAVLNSLLSFALKLLNFLFLHFLNSLIRREVRLFHVDFESKVTFPWFVKTIYLFLVDFRCHHHWLIFLHVLHNLFVRLLFLLLFNRLLHSFLFLVFLLIFFSPTVPFSLFLLLLKIRWLFVLFISILLTIVFLLRIALSELL